MNLKKLFVILVGTEVLLEPGFAQFGIVFSDQRYPGTSCGRVLRLLLANGMDPGLVQHQLLMHSDFHPTARLLIHKLTQTTA